MGKYNFGISNAILSMPTFIFLNFYNTKIKKPIPNCIEIEFKINVLNTIYDKFKKEVVIFLNYEF
jgi:hypothetical protein